MTKEYFEQYCRELWKAECEFHHSADCRFLACHREGKEWEIEIFSTSNASANYVRITYKGKMDLVKLPNSPIFARETIENNLRKLIKDVSV